MKPDQLDKDFKVGDIVWVIPQASNDDQFCRHTISCVLVQLVKSYASGNWWKVLLDNGTLAVYREDWLEAADNH